MMGFTNELNNWNSLSDESRMLAAYGASSYAVADLNINSKKSDKK